MGRQDTTGTARQSNLSLVFKMVSAILLVFSSSLALVAVLSFLKFDRVYLDAYSLRYDSVLLEAKGIIESSLGRGLTLESNTAGSVAIERLAEQHDGNVLLMLHDMDGKLISATGGGHSMDVGAAVAVLQGDPAGIVRARTLSSFTTSAAIRTEGDTLGMVSVEYPSAPAEAELATLQKRMTLAALGTLILFAPIFFALVFVAIFPKARLFAKQAAGMRQITEGGRAAGGQHGLLASAALIQSELENAQPDGPHRAAPERAH